MTLFHGPLTRAAFGLEARSLHCSLQYKKAFSSWKHSLANSCCIRRHGEGPSGLRCMSILHSRNQPARLRVRGLPFSATKAEIAKFFDGFKLAEPADSAVTLLTLPDGRPSGQAVVFFSDAEEALRAQRERHMKFLGSRFLELLIDFDVGGGAQRWADFKPLSENVNRKRYIGDNR